MVELPGIDQLPVVFSPEVDSVKPLIFVLSRFLDTLLSLFLPLRRPLHAQNGMESCCKYTALSQWLTRVNQKVWNDWSPTLLDEETPSRWSPAHVQHLPRRTFHSSRRRLRAHRDPADDFNRNYSGAREAYRAWDPQQTNDPHDSHSRSSWKVWPQGCCIKRPPLSERTACGAVSVRFECGCRSRPSQEVRRLTVRFFLTGTIAFL